MKRKILDEFGHITTDLLGLAIGILFFFDETVSYTILYVLLIVYCFYDPAFLIISIALNVKPKDNIDIFRILFNTALGTALLANPDKFLNYAHFFFGMWMMGSAFFSFIDFYVIKKDVQKGAWAKFLYALYSLAVGIIMVFGSAFQFKTILLSIMAGIFFIMHSVKNLTVHIRMNHPDGFIAKHTTWTIPVPLLLGAFYPLRAYISLKYWKKIYPHEPMKDDSDADVWVYIYLKGTGFEMFGHIDIAYKGITYSYGCHDDENRTLGGTLGDGVLIVADQNEFLKHASTAEDKAIIGYGIKLTEKEKTILEQRINEMMQRTVPWKCKAERYHSDEYEEYPSRLWKDTHCQFYKFTEGKFRTYFVAFTNCALLADYLIRNNELNLITANGVIVPGTYLLFLNNEYLIEGSSVTERYIFLK